MSLNKKRLGLEMARRQMVASRSQADSYIRLGKVKVNSIVADKAGHLVTSEDEISLDQDQQYVSRGALKLDSVVKKLKLDFTNKTILDVGSSTGGFTQFALVHGAYKVIAVDVGSGQLHPNLQGDKRIELHEKTDIRNFKLKSQVDLILIDVSFISLRQVLPAVFRLMSSDTLVLALLKPQFEADAAKINKGVVKNNSIRRRIIKDFERWVTQYFIIRAKADSEVAGSKGNHERFILLTGIQK